MTQHNQKWTVITILVIVASIVGTFTLARFTETPIPSNAASAQTVMPAPLLYPEEDADTAEEYPVAYCDKLVVGQGGYCGAGSTSRCNPNLWVWGHTDGGGDVAFRVLLRDEAGNVLGDSFRTTVADGYYRWVGGLVSQRCDGVLTTSADNEGQPWNACDFLVPTQGAGGYSLTQIVGFQTRSGSLHKHPEVTYTVQVLASPVEWEMTPDGKFLHRWATKEWNWDAMCEVSLRIYYDSNSRQYRCDEASSGEIPYYRAPSITGIAYQISGDDDHQGYANATFAFATDVEAQGRVYYQFATNTGCDPATGWQSSVSTPGTDHTVSLAPETLWYDVEVPKTYCYQIMAWPPEYQFVDTAEGHTEVYTFTIPSP